MALGLATFEYQRIPKWLLSRHTIHPLLECSHGIVMESHRPTPPEDVRVMFTSDWMEPTYDDRHWQSQLGATSGRHRRGFSSSGKSKVIMNLWMPSDREQLSIADCVFLRVGDNIHYDDIIYMWHPNMWYVYDTMHMVTSYNYMSKEMKEIETKIDAG